MLTKTVFIWFALISSLTSSFFALGRGEIIPVQDRAQGQSLVAGHLGNDALYSNPAAAAFTSIYSVEATYRSKEEFAASIVDTKTSGIGGALGFFRTPRRYLTQSPQSSRRLQGLKLGLAWRASQNIAVGVAGKHLWGEAKVGSASDQFEDRNFKDIDIGVTANLGMVQLGATTRNVIGGDEGYEENSEHAFGVRINYNQLLFLSLATHTNSSMHPYQYGVGAEYVSPYRFSIKGGYRQVMNEIDLHETRQTKGGHYWSVGASLNSPKLGLHYAAEFPSASDESTEHTLAVAFLL